MQKQMRKSTIVPEKTFYLKYDKEGNTQKLGHSANLAELACYRQVHHIPDVLDDHRGPSLFHDSQYSIGLQQFDKEDIVLRRLSTLYGVTNHPKFFDIKSSPTKPKDPRIVPHCINELALFDTIHYKSLFLTQQFSATGKYVLIINVDGKFEPIFVDDIIPVYRSTLEPIWGLSFQNPWEIILVKAWAKKLGGYHNVRNSNPFQFIQSFTNSTWKYFNLTRSKEEFLHKYSDFSKFKFKFQMAKVILKSKEQNNGFLGNSASFELVGGRVVKTNDRQSYSLAVQGTSKSSWRGELSYLDKQSISEFDGIDPTPNISLDRGFLISGEEFINNFSAVYITSKRDNNYFSGYKSLQVAANEKKAQYFTFVMPTDGFFDFSIKQSHHNVISSESNVKASNVKGSLRYLKNKYILIKDNNYTGQQKNSLHPTESAVRPLSSSNNPSILNSNFNSSENTHEYVQPRYAVFEIEYLKGYNQGDTHFLRLSKGRYYLRLKSELTNKAVQYSINWLSTCKLDIEACDLNHSEKVEMLHHSFVSIMHKQEHYSLEKGQKSEMITFGNTFDQVGYGFVAVKSSLTSPHSIILEVNPQKLKEEGYSLKGRYKEVRQPFHIIIERGEFESVVLKHRKDATHFQWPTKAIKIHKKLVGQSVLRSEVKQSHKAPQSSHIGGRESNNPAQSNTLNHPIPEEKEEEHDEWKEKAHH